MVGWTVILFDRYLGYRIIQMSGLIKFNQAPGRNSTVTTYDNIRLGQVTIDMVVWENYIYRQAVRSSKERSSLKILTSEHIYDQYRPASI
jgi:hypothetical protein